MAEAGSPSQCDAAVPTQRFPLEPGGPERLSLIHNRMGTKSTIAIDGKPLLADLTRKQLGEGVAVTLPDGSSLTVKMIAAGFLKGDQNGLDIRRNGIPIPGSVGTPEHAVRTAKTTGIFLYVLAGLNAAAGVVIQLAGNDPSSPRTTRAGRTFWAPSSWQRSACSSTARCRWWQSASQWPTCSSTASPPCCCRRRRARGLRQADW